LEKKNENQHKNVDPGKKRPQDKKKVCNELGHCPPQRTKTKGKDITGPRDSSYKIVNRGEKKSIQPTSPKELQKLRKLPQENN